ncbi:DeoR/GlpR transcriptional regulator, partial [Mycobacterium tuberculosis]|nr:DeoR/GlpR transcriptional regulator [Mycobacterium tuberculosis]
VGVGPFGAMESDPLIIQGEQKLINQADELVLLVDSSKFERRSSLILCPLQRVATIITDDGIADADRKMVEDAGVELI